MMLRLALFTVIALLAGGAVAFAASPAARVTVDAEGEALATLDDGTRTATRTRTARRSRSARSPRQRPRGRRRTRAILGPPRANERDCNGATTTITARNDTRYIDCPNLTIPNLAKRITVVGDEIPQHVVRGVKDVYIGGRPGRLMNNGPRGDGQDLFQVKGYPVNGVIQHTEGLTLRWIRFHDLTRPATGPGSDGHIDGIQVMGGRNGKILDSRFERVGQQPIFFRYGGTTAYGGPIENWLVRRSHIKKPPNGFYTVRIAGNGDALVPSRITLRDLGLGANVGIDRAAFKSGFKAKNLRGGRIRVLR